MKEKHIYKEINKNELLLKNIIEKLDCLLNKTCDHLKTNKYNRTDDHNTLMFNFLSSAIEELKLASDLLNKGDFTTTFAKLRVIRELMTFFNVMSSEKFENKNFVAMMIIRISLALILDDSKIKENAKTNYCGNDFENWYKNVISKNCTPIKYIKNFYKVRNTLEREFEEKYSLDKTFIKKRNNLMNESSHGNGLMSKITWKSLENNLFNSYLCDEAFHSVTNLANFIFFVASKTWGAIWCGDEINNLCFNANSSKVKTIFKWQQ